MAWDYLDSSRPVWYATSMVEERVCSRCNLLKVITDFPIRRGDLRRTICKLCSAGDSRTHYMRNRQRYLDKNVSKRAQMQAWVRAYKESTPCADCGQQYAYYKMDFDHVDGEKSDIVSRLTSISGSWRRLKAEIAKCELVCALCHRERTWQREQHLGVGKQPTRLAWDQEISRANRLA